MTPGIAKMLAPLVEPRVLEPAFGGLDLRRATTMPTYGPGPISASRSCHAATRSGSATRNERRSGNASSVGRNQRMRLPAGIARSKSCIVSPAHVVVRLRAHLGVGERAREQRRRAAWSHLDHDLARRVDEVGIQRREHDLVADALLRGTRARARRCRPASSAARSTSRSVPRRPPWIAALPRVERLGEPARRRAARSRGSRGSRCCRVRPRSPGGSASTASSKRPSCMQHDADVAVRGRAAARRARARASTISSASSRWPSMRWLLPSTVHTAWSSAQPSSMRARSETSALCSRPRWWSTSPSTPWFGPKLGLRASPRAASRPRPRRSARGPSASGRGCATAATRVARPRRACAASLPRARSRPRAAQHVGVVVVEAERRRASAVRRAAPRLRRGRSAPSMSLRSASSAPSSCVARFVVRCVASDAAVRLLGRGEVARRCCARRSRAAGRPGCGRRTASCACALPLAAQRPRLSNRSVASQSAESPDRL